MAKPKQLIPLHSFSHGKLAPDIVVANSPIVIPRAQEIERVVVGAGPDAADDWIAERAGPGAIVVTSDVPLAS